MDRRANRLLDGPGVIMIPRYVVASNLGNQFVVLSMLAQAARHAIRSPGNFSARQLVTLAASNSKVENMSLR